MAYDIGDVVRVTTTFTKLGVVTDPTTVTFRVKPPSGTLVDYVYGTDANVAKVSTGVFRVDVDVDAAGTWYVRSIGTGTAEGVEEIAFYVEPAQAA